ncbi:hypothetical protein HK102_011315, partial [Quaeritorhiza haematococci]
MNRLVKGAEYTLSSASDMFSKAANTSGDLANNILNRGGGFLVMGRSREDLGFSGDGSRGMIDIGEEADFTEQAMDSSPAIQTPIEEEDVLDEKDHGSADSLNKDQASDGGSSVLLPYAQISTAQINTVEDLNTQLRNIEFRNLFRLPHSETILHDEPNCHFWHKVTTTSFSGNLYLTQNFLNFASLSSPSSAATLGASAAGMVSQGASGLSAVLGGGLTSSSSAASGSAAAAAAAVVTGMSMLFDSPSEPTLSFVIPYPHITSITKQPPTALSTGLKLANISLSGYLVINTKNKQE